MTPTTPVNVDPAQWLQSVGLARQACARIFRDGGTPADALIAFGIPADRPDLNWSKTIDLIAEHLNAYPVREAA